MKNKIVVASDSFKGSANSEDIAKYIKEGIHSIDPNADVETFAIADGGEGTVSAIVESSNGSYITVEVSDPLGEIVTATYGLLEDGETAIIEMAEASGLNVVSKEKRDILNSSTYGTGELILDAIKRKVKKIYIGIGGSATNDGGMGMAQALGVKFKDNQGNILGKGAKYLDSVKDIDISEIPKEIKDIEVIVLSDVTNPLCGKDGASEIYGPQKGASKEDIRYLDESLSHYAAVIEDKLDVDIKDTPGAGAAGGLGAGLMVFTEAHLENGITEILKLVKIERSIKSADLVITGEGKIDSQTISGKAPIGIAKIAKKYNKPVFAVVGSSDSDTKVLFEKGIDGIFDIIYKPMTLEESIENTEELVKIAARNAMNIYITLKK